MCEMTDLAMAILHFPQGYVDIKRGAEEEAEEDA
jgi:hypothetical protein